MGNDVPLLVFMFIDEICSFFSTPQGDNKGFISASGAAGTV